jgi:integrase
VSIHKQAGKWRVKYRQNGRQRSRTFTRKDDARTFDREMARRLQLGPTLAAELDRSTMTLGDYITGPWRAHAATLSAPTRAKYAWALELHLAELLDEPLITLDAPAIAAHQQFLLDNPRVKGKPQTERTASTVREAMSKLAAILQVAAEHGLIPANPARSIRNVSAEYGEEVDPLTPVELEKLIRKLTGRDRAIALLGGHLGLRPLEIRQVPCTALADGKLTIGRAHTKASARRSRVIDLPAVTARELRAWQMQSGVRGSDPIIGEMSPNAMKIWNVRHLRPAVAAVTDGRITDATAYLLRHTHATALHYVSSFTDPEIFRRLGHKHQVHYQHYAHIIDALDGHRFADLDEMIEQSQSATRCSLSVP